MSRPKVCYGAAVMAFVSGLASAMPSAVAATTGGPTITSVTVGLKSLNAGLIRRMAHTPDLPQRLRETLLDEALPGVAEFNRLQSAARADSLRRIGATRFSATYAGSPSALAAFTEQERQSASVAYVAEDTGIPVWRPLDANLNGVTARQVYQAPEGLTQSRSEPTIATVQFSGWNSGDLAQYAQQTGVPDPVASGQYTAVSVDGSSPSTPDGTGGDKEVAMDQETLLSVAPHLNQRAYFAPSGNTGLIDALNQIATDALDASHNYFGLAAVSISWGNCEAAVAASGGNFSALDQAIQNVLAAGVTIFAASGDTGGFDCAPKGVSGPAVDFPASDPYVVGVGGTSLTATNPVSEVAWSYDNATGAGGGGGVSDVFEEPSYQQPIVTANGRVVPDIALDADPNTGVEVFSGDSWFPAGGTSLAAPLAASTFTDLLASDDLDGGIGWIQPNLYAASATGFRDITTGNNGVYQAGPGFDAVTGLGAPLWSGLADALIGSPRVSAPTYSRSRQVPVSVSTPQGMRYSSWLAGTDAQPSGCGATSTTTRPTVVNATHDGQTSVWVIGNTDSGWCYTGEATTFVDTALPSLGVVIRRSGRHVTIQWTAHDAPPSSGLKPFFVSVRRVGAARTIFYGSTLSHQTSFVAAKGAAYRVHVTAADRAGNIGSANRSFRG